jgi:hypothetical protein
MEQTRETIKISSLKDIIDKVPIENVESFLVDLRSRIWLTHTSNQLKKILPPWSIEYDDTTIQRVNDGENYANIKIDLHPTRLMGQTREIKLLWTDIEDWIICEVWWYWEGWICYVKDVINKRYEKQAPQEDKPKIEQFNKYICRIKFRNSDKYVLKEWLEKYNWQVLEFQAMWIIEDTDIYVWEWAMANSLLPSLVWWWWIASWDLEFLSQ